MQRQDRPLKGAGPQDQLLCITVQKSLRHMSFGLVVAVQRRTEHARSSREDSKAYLSSSVQEKHLCICKAAECAILDELCIDAPLSSMLNLHQATA